MTSNFRAEYNYWTSIFVPSLIKIGRNKIAF